ncbi:MAG: arsenate reductase ArsC [Nitrospiraceae bacterium]|nr:arsenate reductase ArsC [Nitrospiraceae bacterium]
MNQRRSRLLFLCTGNSCRSQMGEAWTRHLWGDRFEVYSAGIAPHGMDARTVRVMEEVGINMDGYRSKHVDELKGLVFDIVITVCDEAREACPFFPGEHLTLHQGFEDPPVLARDAKTEEEALRHYRRIRDEIRAYVATFPEVLTVSGHDDGSLRSL